MESTSFRFSSLFFFFIIAVIAGYSDVVVGLCVYTIRVRTGTSINEAGHFTIKLILGDGNGKTVMISNLVEWGLNEPCDHYFQKENLDYFTGTGACIEVCNINVDSHGTGNRPTAYSWHLNNVEVVTDGYKIVSCKDSPTRFPTVTTGSNQFETPSLSKFTFNQTLDFNAPIARRNKCDTRAEGAGSANRKVHANKRSGSAFDIVRALE